jgi:hypothetical protein
MNTHVVYTHKEYNYTIHSHKDHAGTIKHDYLQPHGLSAAKFMIKAIYYAY